MPDAEQRSISDAELGRRLRATREAAGLTQKAVADQLEMARTTLVAIEKGERRVRSTEVVALADLYGESVGRMMRSTAVVPDLTPQFRRSSTASGSDNDTVAVTRQLRSLAASYSELERRFGSPLAMRLPAEWKPVRGQLREQGEDLAQDVRRMLGVGPGSPIDRLSQRLEEEFGIRVFVRPLPSKMAGAFAFADGIGACILVNSLHPTTRQRWTIAHEVGHFMTNRDAADVLRLGEQENEQIADFFAAGLLLPAQEMRRRVREAVASTGRFSTRDLLLAAGSFIVSPEALCRRLEALGQLAKGTYESLCARGMDQRSLGSVDGIGDPEPVGSPTRFAMLAVRGYELGELSEGQVATLLGLDRVSVRELLLEYGEPGLSDDLTA